jgi:hypothetical protein
MLGISSLLFLEIGVSHDHRAYRKPSISVFAFDAETVSIAKMTSPIVGDFSFIERIPVHG